jgi:hypothetical protein
VIKIIQLTFALIVVVKKKKKYISSYIIGIIDKITKKEMKGLIGLIVVIGIGYLLIGNNTKGVINRGEEWDGEY